MGASWSCGLAAELEGTVEERLEKLVELARLGQTSFEDVVEGTAYGISVKGAVPLEGDHAQGTLWVMKTTSGSAPWGMLGDGYEIEVGFPTWSGPSQLSGTGCHLDGRRVGGISELAAAARWGLECARESDDADAQQVCTGLVRALELASEHNMPFSIW